MDETGQKKYKRGVIREENERIILDAAAQEFVLNGFRGTTMNSIAERSGLPKANIHYYFKNKISLYGAVLHGVIDMWDASFNELSPSDDPAEVLSRYIYSKVMFSRDNPIASRLFALEIISGGENLTEYFGRNYQEWFAGRAQVFQSWIDQGKMDPVDPSHVIFMIWASTQHYADFVPQICRSLPSGTIADEDYERAAETLIHIILKGCGLSKGLVKHVLAE